MKGGGFPFVRKRKDLLSGKEKRHKETEKRHQYPSIWGRKAVMAGQTLIAMRTITLQNT